MRNVFVKWAVGALVLLTAAAPLRAEDPFSDAPPPPPPHDDKNSTTLPPVPPGTPATAGTLRLPSGPTSRIDGLVNNIKSLRLDPASSQRIALALERAPGMNARQFSELVTLTGRLFERLTPEQQNELKRLFSEETTESKDLAGIPFSSALRVANAEEAAKATKGNPPAVGPNGEEVANKNPLAGASASASRSAIGGGSPGSLDQLVEQATKRQSAQLEQLIKTQLDQTKKAIEALGVGKGDGGGAPQQAPGNSAKGLLDGLLADLRKGGKGEEGGGRERGGRDKEDDEPRSKKKEEDHSNDKKGEDRAGELSKLRERERERDQERNRNANNRSNNKGGGGGESKDSSSGDKKDENKKDGGSSFSSSKKEAPNTESKMQKSDFKSLLDEQKKRLEPEVPVPATPPVKKGPGESTPIDQALPAPSGGAAGVPSDDGSQGQGSGNPKGSSMSGAASGSGSGSFDGDPFGSIGYGDDGGGGASERFSFARLVEYGGAGGGGGFGGEVATTVDGGLVDDLLATNDKGPRAAGSARESGQVLRVGIESSPKAKRWVFDWTNEWPKQICSGADAKEVGVCEKVLAIKNREEMRRRLSGAKEAAARM